MIVACAERPKKLQVSVAGRRTTMRTRAARGSLSNQKSSHLQYGAPDDTQAGIRQVRSQGKVREERTGLELMRMTLYPSALRSTAVDSERTAFRMLAAIERHGRLPQGQDQQRRLAA